MIEDAVYGSFDKISKFTPEIVMENIKRNKDLIDEFEDARAGVASFDIMVSTATASHLFLNTIVNILCELLCDEEKADESSNESNEIILDAGKSLTVINGNHRIEINDNGVVVFNSESSK